MAIIFSDGCGEYYSTTEMLRVWSAFAGATVVASGGRRNGAHISINNIDSVLKYLPSSQEMFIGFGLRMDSTGSFTHVLTTGFDGGAHVTLHVTASGALEARLNSSTILATTDVGIIASSVWYFVELRVLIDNGTSGQVEIRLDGLSRAVDNATDTQNGATALVNYVSWAETVSHFDIDDVYVCDTTGSAPQNTFLGDIQIDRLTPDGAGVTSDFDTTTGSANHWENVDDVRPDDDTTSNETNTANDVDMFTFDNLPALSGGGTVLGVKAVAYVKKLDAGLAQIQLVARPDVTNVVGTTKALQTSYAYHVEYYDEDPDASIPWTEASVDGSEFGVKAL